MRSNSLHVRSLRPGNVILPPDAGVQPAVLDVVERSRPGFGVRRSVTKKSTFRPSTPDTEESATETAALVASTSIAWESAPCADVVHDVPEEERRRHRVGDERLIDLPEDVRFLADGDVAERGFLLQLGEQGAHERRIAHERPADAQGPVPRHELRLDAGADRPSAGTAEAPQRPVLVYARQVQLVEKDDQVGARGRGRSRLGWRRERGRGRRRGRVRRSRRGRRVANEREVRDRLDACRPGAPRSRPARGP